MSDGTHCLGFVSGVDLMKPWTPVVSKALGKLVVVPYWCEVWHGLGPLVHINTPLTGALYISLLGGHL